MSVQLHECIITCYLWVIHRLLVISTINFVVVISAYLIFVLFCFVGVTILMSPIDRYHY